MIATLHPWTFNLKYTAPSLDTVALNLFTQNVLFRRAGQFAIVMSMPIATMHKNHSFVFPENKIRSSW